MKNITEHIGTLQIIDRLPNSANGNPRFILTIDGFTCYTAPDSAHGYAVQNHDGKRVKATIGTHYNKPTLHTLKGIE